jgi:hypothetical protein
MSLGFSVVVLFFALAFLAVVMLTVLLLKQ